MSNELSLTILRFVVGLVIGGYSVALVAAQHHGKVHHSLLLLGLAELIAAILFLIPATVRIGGIALLAVFVAAALFHILHGEYSLGYLAVYAAATFAVISNWRRA